jgi:WD40 repeat protein
VQETVDALVNLSLASLDEAGASGQRSTRLIIHDLVVSYLHQTVDDIAKRRARLLAAYNTAYDGDPANGPDDRFFFQQFPNLLHAAGQEDDLGRLLVDPRWLRAKLVHCGVEVLLADFALLPQSAQIGDLVDAIRLAAPALIEDPDALVPQLLARLGEDRNALVRSIATADSSASVWLRPLCVSLTTPGRLRCYLVGHTWSILGLAAASRTGLLVSGSGDRTLRLWESAGWTKVGCLGVDGIVDSIAVSADGSTVAALWSNDLTVWDVVTGKVIAVHRDLPWSRMLALVAPNLIVVAGQRITEIRNDKKVTRFNQPVRAIAATTEGRLFLSGEDENVLVLPANAVAGPLPFGAMDARVTCLAVDAAGKRVVAGSASGAVMAWRGAGGQPIELRGHKDAVEVVAIAADGNRAVSAARDGTIRAWDLESQTQTHELPRGPSPSRMTNLLAMTPDGRFVVEPLFNTLRVWELREPGANEQLPRQRSSVHRIVVTPDGAFAFSASEEGTICKWDLEHGRCIGTWQAPDGELDDIAVAGSTSHLAVLSRISLSLLNYSDGQVAKRIELADIAEESPTFLPIRLPMKLALLGIDEGAIIERLGSFWKIDFGAPGTRFHRELTFSRVKMLAATPDCRCVIAACAGGLGVIRASDLAEESFLKGHTAYVEGVAISADGRRAVSGSDDQTICVWDLELRKELRRLPIEGARGHTGWVRSVAISGNGRFIASGGYDHIVMVWDADSGESRARFRGDTMVTACSMSPDGRTIIAGEMSGSVYPLRLEGSR